WKGSPPIVSEADVDNSDAGNIDQHVRTSDHRHDESTQIIDVVPTEGTVAGGASHQVDEGRAPIDPISIAERSTNNSQRVIAVIVIGRILWNCGVGGGGIAHGIMKVGVRAKFDIEHAYFD